MRKIMRIILVATILAAIIIFPVAAGNGGNSDQPTNRQKVDNSSIIVQLKGDPLSIYSKTKPPQGKKIDFNSTTVKSYRAQLSALRNDFKNWLRTNAPKAKVTGEYDISLNAVAVQLNGEALGTIAGAPMVATAQYEGLYYPTEDDPDLGLIHAVEAWQQGSSPANAGVGVKVAIIDTGIDIHHPCFSDTGYDQQLQLGDTRFTNNKVIAAKVFYNKNNQTNYTAEAVQEHGTHVAGTVACNANTPASVDGVAIPYGISGVAPKAVLGNYNIFPGAVESARSEDILNALEAAYADGFDVANMSLGGGSSGIQDLVAMAVDDLDQANMVIAVAAGNSGPGFYTVESPGKAARALTAGAATVGHGLAVSVSIGGTVFWAMQGDFGKATVSGPLAVLRDTSSTDYGGLSLACNPLPDGSLAGKIALLSRGVCDFTTKVRNVQNAGGVGALVVNRVPGLMTMGQNGDPDQPTIPAYLVDLKDRDALMALDGKTTTFNPPAYRYDSSQDYRMADFSSQGPTDVDFRVKPDVVAPGVNVLSSIPVSYCGGNPCFAFFQGTSMATPHLAGSAAVVKWEHPTWTAAQIRSAIVNTADRTLLTDYLNGNPQENVNISGAGFENLSSAVSAQVALDPVSVSFGAIPSGSGQTQTFNVTLSNVTSGSMTYTVAAGKGDKSVSYLVSPSTMTLASGQSAVVKVNMTASKSATVGGHQVWLTVTVNSKEVAHAALFTFIK